jgi:hypothetical protein
MNICVSVICGDCKKDINSKTTKYGLDGHGRCARCHKAHGAELYYLEEAIIIGDDRDFEEIASAAGATMVDGHIGEWNYDPDREVILMFVGSKKDLAWLSVKLDGKAINKKNVAQALKLGCFVKLDDNDAKRYAV